MTALLASTCSLLLGLLTGAALQRYGDASRQAAADYWAWRGVA